MALLDADEVESRFKWQNETKGEDGEYGRCRLCGKPITSGKGIVWVHEHFGGGVFITEDEVPALDPAADMGWFPIGRDCYRKHQAALAPFVREGKR